MLSLLLAAAVAAAPPAYPDDADKASLLAAVAKTRAYLAAVRKPSLTLLGRSIATERFRRSAARFEELINEKWGTPEFDQALDDEFELVDPRTPVRFTGYHLPLLEARAHKDATFRFPLYAPPPDMLAVPLGTFKPTLAGQVLTGRLKGSTVVPYFTRTEIDDGNALAGKGLEVAWVADELARYSLMVQGSGMLHFEDGRTVNVNYAGQNGHPYTGLGKALVADGKLPMATLSMPAIEAYFKANPGQMHGYLNRNASYIFFKVAPNGPFGVDGIALTSGRSIATDKGLYPSGAITYLKYPRARFDDKGQVVGWDQGARFVCDQDTGGAITGPGRVDIFYGGGQEAARRAGTLNGMGSLNVLLLKD